MYTHVKSLSGYVHTAFIAQRVFVILCLFERLCIHHCEWLGSTNGLRGVELGPELCGGFLDSSVRVPTSIRPCWTPAGMRRYPTYMYVHSRTSQKSRSVMCDPLITDTYVTTSVKVAGAFPSPACMLNCGAAV